MPSPPRQPVDYVVLSLVVAAGGQGLVLLASGRYTETEVDLDELVRQGRQLRGF
jgi:hypothetical protein